MDEDRLQQRAEHVLQLLHCTDPRFPRLDFYQKLVSLTVTDEAAALASTAEQKPTADILLHLSRCLVQTLEAEKRWDELVGGWFPEDIFNGLLACARTRR